MQLYHSLKTKLWLIILFSFIPASVIIFSNMFYEYRAAKEEVEIEALQIASSLASEQFTIIKEAKEFLIQLSQIDNVKNPGSLQCKQIVQQALKLNTHYVNIAIAGLDGSFDCSALSSNSVINIADRPYFKKTVSNQVFSISGFQIDRIIKRDTINFAYPVYGLESTLVGAAVAVISLDWWSKRLAEFSLPENTIAVLVDNNGNVLTSNNNIITHYDGKVPAVVKQKMYTKKPFVFEVKNGKGVPLLAASVPLFPHDIKNYSQMIIALPLDDAYQGVMTTLIRSVSLFVISTILFLLILLLGFNRSVIQPIQTLLSSTQKYVEKKRGSKFSGGNELSNLSENFDWVVQEQGFIEKELIDKELRLNRAYTRINNLLDNSTYGVVEWGPNLTIRRWSQSCQHWFRLHADELLDQDITLRPGIIGNYFSQMTHELEKMREGHSEHAECEIPFIKEDNTVIILIWKLSALYDGNDLIGILGLVDDITKQVEYQQEIEHQAYFDGLTGLPNRYALLNSMNSYLSIQQPFTILHIDIKGFKFINDHYGHLYGDELLVELSLRINEEVSKGEFFARLGGNEFIYLVSSHDKEALSLRIKELRVIINAPIQIKESNHITHVNLGIATCDLCGKDAEELLRQAGVALHYAKRHSLLDVFYYSSEMENKERMRFNLESDLRNALERQEFELYYQPILNQRTSMFDSAEALIRWNHPHKGLVSPNEFIPLAEETGLIHQLGYWVLFESIRQLKEWQENATGVNKVSVNMSAIQLSDVDIVDKMKHVISYYNVEPNSIVIEVTESALLDSAGEVLERIKLIKDLGVLIALDDFGTGYSSLSYLSNLPLNRLKIDRSFVNRIGSTRDEVLINAIISIAHGMNLSVVAEGIETNEHLEFLMGKGCEYGQGFLFSKPLSVTEFEAFIKLHSFHKEIIDLEPKFM
ncbi:bifunctional diguanylate cyclase/phosphodiesterase [Aliivibrio sifiae]|uniref:Uncharacterized protein n=1 Tax=Aliivibrio sifiae TaxID=566293 RepID=A0A2S7X737_9GAMM|nr:EAL domain-containing protein [Aliivibrio sifiae]PQJ87151.1 hypothetical protein BTO23_13555 [Aliivibrio sifiae]GLR73713.1 hypothetical protein GCM10007855_05870 [Aliivibrio sifiae]